MRGLGLELELGAKVRCEGEGWVRALVCVRTSWRARASLR